MPDRRPNPALDRWRDELARAAAWAARRKNPDDRPRDGWRLSGLAPVQYWERSTSTGTTSRTETVVGRPRAGLWSFKVEEDRKIIGRGAADKLALAMLAAEQTGRGTLIGEMAPVGHGEEVHARYESPDSRPVIPRGRVFRAGLLTRRWPGFGQKPAN